MPEEFTLLSRPDTLLVFTTAPTGFGHIRVTEALKSALPPEIPYHLLGVHDPNFEFFYSLQSRLPLFRHLSESIQNSPLMEDGFSFSYRNFLNFSSQHTYEVFAQLIQNQPVPPTEVVVVATHFSLAHQVAHCKAKLEANFHLRLTLAVIVTDDSPQHIWAVPQADFIFVPSLTTKKGLDSYLKTLTKTPPQTIISPYPLSTTLSKVLSPQNLISRRLQLDPQSNETTNIMIPISGAAVQLPYLKDLISVLIENPRLHITLISRESTYTNPYLDWFSKYPQITIYSSPDDEQVVNLYEQVYSQNTFALEITKPSEQSFKALLPPDTVGGAILLFAPPVGRQEVDNLHFLRRHHLLTSLKTNPHECRALTLPEDGTKAGHKIISLLKTSLFSQMLEFQGFIPHPELDPHGSEIFWSILNTLI